MPDPRTLATDRAPVCQGPDPAPHPPRRFKVPAGAVDCHAHVIGHPPRYRLVADRSYTPPEASSAAYTAMLDATGMAYGVLVQVSVHGTDNSLMVETLQAAPDHLRGVCVVAPDVTGRELEALAAAGVVGCRFNVLFGGGVGFEVLETIARRVAPFQWHIQLLLDVRHLPELAPRLSRLPVPIVFDHMGHLPADLGSAHPGFQTLLALLRDGDCWVKISGAYRLSRQGMPYADTVPFARALVAQRADRLVWGSDWPHVSLDGPMPNVGDLLDLVADWVPDPAARDRILVDNAHRLYGFGRVSR
jgi:predicted TIM-barrel fold metal-dependent hydrolase